MDGTLSSIDLGTSVRYQLTRKEDGRTKTIYVPRHAAAEVADWTGRHAERGQAASGKHRNGEPLDVISHVALLTIC